MYATLKSYVSHYIQNRNMLLREQNHCHTLSHLAGGFNVPIYNLHFELSSYSLTLHF